MAYNLEGQESFQEGVCRIALELHHSAIDALAGDDEVTHEGVHQARRLLKRLRSLLELLRYAIGKGTYREGSAFYRSLARQLELQRDISSLIEATAALQVQYSDLLKTDAFGQLTILLEAEKTALLQGAAGQHSITEPVIQALQQGRERWQQMALPDICLEDAVHTLFRQYKAAHKLFRKVQGQPATEDMHEWRKRTKHLWHFHELLLHSWHKVFKAYIKYWKELGDTLGYFHDLALLQDKLDAYEGQLPEESRRLLRAIAQEQMNALHRQSIKLGERLYAEQADAFARRMQGILTAWDMPGLSRKPV